MTVDVFSLRDGRREIIAGPVGDIELVFHPGRAVTDSWSEGGVAVVCHPHPLHGGTMDNKVVTTLVRAYCELGVPTVRFNFRGVGATDGVHDHGEGESADLAVVVDWAARAAGADQLLLAGFSFGTLVALRCAESLTQLRHVALVAPPIAHATVSVPTRLSCPLAVVVAGADEVVDNQATFEWVSRLESEHELLLIDDASHFFHGRLNELRERLQATWRQLA